MLTTTDKIFLQNKAREKSMDIYEETYLRAFGPPKTPFTAKKKRQIALFAQELFSQLLAEFEAERDPLRTPLRDTFAAFIVSGVFVRKGPKGGYKGQMAAFCEKDRATYSVVLLTKRPESAELFEQQPYKFLDQIAELAFSLGGKKNRTYHAPHPTLGRIFVDCLSIPDATRLSARWKTNFVSESTTDDFLQRRILGWQGPPCPEDPVLSKSLEESDVFDTPTPKEE